METHSSVLYFLFDIAIALVNLDETKRLEMKQARELLLNPGHLASKLPGEVITDTLSLDGIKIATFEVFNDGIAVLDLLGGEITHTKHLRLL